MAELARSQWETIREEYEGGASQASLAKRYGISRKAVQNHITKEGWTVAGGVTPATMRPMLLPIPTGATTIARIGISPETRMEIRRLLALDAQEREQVS